MQYKTQLLCKTTGKLSFASEAKAIRAVNKYDEIKRSYWCKSCLGFHLTSETEGQTLGRNILDCEEENKLLRVQNSKLVDEVINLKKKLWLKAHKAPCKELQD
jgi:hypothetical protein